MSTHMIHIANDFSRHPGGRYLKDGPNSGERFRKDFLLPHLQHGENITVDLDGTRGYGSSFLDEAFAGLVREHLITNLVDFEKRIKFKTENRQETVFEIMSYVKEEFERAHHS